MPGMSLCDCGLLWRSLLIISIHCSLSTLSTYLLIAHLIIYWPSELQVPAVNQGSADRARATLSRSSISAFADAVLPCSLPRSHTVAAHGSLSTFPVCPLSTAFHLRSTIHPLLPPSVVVRPTLFVPLFVLSLLSHAAAAHCVTAHSTTRRTICWPRRPFIPAGRS